MLYLRPQRVYKPSALSYLGDPSDIVDSIIDRYLNKDLYRLRIETPRGTSITADNSQITCYAHIFDEGDGTELTDLLKGRGFHPTWLLDGKPIDSARISEEGYQLTLETDHLPAIYQAVTLQARDTDILLALTTDEIQKRIYSQLIELGSIPTNLLKTSEKLLNISRLDKIRVEGLEEIKQDLAKALASKQPAGSYALTSELATSQQQAVDEAVRQAGEMDKQIKVGGRNLIRNGSEAKRQCGEWVTYRLYKPIEQSEPLTLSFDVIKVEKPPIGGRFLVFFFYYSNFRTATSVKYEEGKKRYSVSVQALNYNYDLYGDKKDYDPDAVFIYPNSSYDSGGGCFTVSNVKLERGTVVTDWTPAPEDVENTMAMLENSLSLSNGEIDYLKKAVTSKADRLAVDESFSSMIGRSDKRFKNAFDRIFNIDLQLQGIPRIDVDGSGRIAVSAKSESCPVNPGYNPDDDVNLRSCSNGVSPVNIQLVLRSDFDTLKQQVNSISARLNQLEDSANITPVLDTTLRRRPSLIDKSKVTLYPLYGDWILTSDSEDQYISFSGLSAEIGKSIYIQTRRKAYLYVNGHSFFGLPSVSDNQWLTKNTTYRFVRAESTAWLVTASSSPYPWT